MLRFSQLTNSVNKPNLKAVPTMHLELHETYKIYETFYLKTEINVDIHGHCNVLSLKIYILHNST